MGHISERFGVGIRGNFGGNYFFDVSSNSVPRALQIEEAAHIQRILYENIGK